MGVDWEEVFLKVSFILVRMEKVFQLAIFREVSMVRISQLQDWQVIQMQ